MEKIVLDEKNVKFVADFDESNPLNLSFLEIDKAFSQKEEASEGKNKETEVKTDEDYKRFISDLFKIRGFIANEQWEKAFNISSKIIHHDKANVICECLLDKEKGIFEKRSFPRHLFDHIDDLVKTPFVVLSIKSKVGSTRIDVIRGEELVDKKVFELSDAWEKLDGNGFNQPLDKPLEL